MALLNENNMYIKVNTDGSYDIYPTQADRDKVKNATPFEIIKNKYEEIITNLEQDNERQYYDIKAWNIEYSSWFNEYQRYLYDYQLKKGGKNYPLMQTFFADISDSVPNIIQSGSIVVSKNTSAEIYAVSKERKYWGETEDV